MWSHACRVEYFGVKLEGFAFTEAGWVQSYGSRYVRPPIIYGDVSRTGPITVKEFKPVRTGPHAEACQGHANRCGHFSLLRNPDVLIKKSLL